MWKRQIRSAYENKRHTRILQEETACTWHVLRSEKNVRLMIWLTNASLKPLLKISEAWCSLNSISKCCIVVKASALLFPCCLADPSGLLGWENMAVFSTSTAQGPWQEGLQGHRIVYTEMDLKRIAHSTWQSIGLGPMMMTREDKLCWPDSNAMTLCATVW